ncbi:MAG: MarR family transcriptional regulator [Patescibacteria group bacterium]
MESVQKQLEELGLSPNEVRVYLASLELGAATVLQIAAKSAVVRPTAHVVVGALVKRGLMSSHTRGKKQYIQAERPEVLMRVLEDEKRKILANEGRLKALMPKLHALISIVGARPEVHYYEDHEGLQTMRAVLFSSKVSDLRVIGAPEKYKESVDSDSTHAHNFRLERSSIKIRQLVLYTKKKNFHPRSKNISWKYLKSDELDCGEIALFGDYIALVVYLDKPHGFLVKSKEIAKVGKRLFDAAWNSVGVDPVH